MMLRKVGADGAFVAASALAFIFCLAGPAYAHGADAPDATNYRTMITKAPLMPGLRVETIEAGARLQLTNGSGRNVEVLGYQGEPYLEVRPDGVYENIHSPATYLNITIAHVDPPAHADPRSAPEWRKVSDEPMWRWHDQRAIWTSPVPPDFVSANPGVPHHIRDWTVPMRVDATPLELAGTLDYEPPPAAWMWWAASVLGIGIVALLGLSSRRVMVGRMLAALVTAAGVLGLVYGVAREIDAGNETLWAIVSQLFISQLWPTVTSLAAIAAGVDALVARKGEGDFALALGGASVALFAGMVNAAAFHRSITPVHWDPTLARVVIASVIALGGGGAVAAMLRLRRTGADREPDPQ